MNEKVVIIGEDGFIGSTVKKYSQDYSIFNVVSFGRKDCDLLEEVKEEIGMTCENANILIAAGIPRSKSNDKKDQENNIKIIKNLISIFKKYQPKSILFLSSVEVYGQNSTLPIWEGSPIDIENNLYAEGKLVAERELSHYVENKNIGLCILRLPGVYGSGNRYGLISKLIKSIENNKTFFINGSGETLRDFVFARDIARFFLELIKKDFKQNLLLNFSSGKSLTLNEICREVCFSFGRCEIYRDIKKNYSLFNLVFNAEKLLDIFPNFKMTPLKEGVRELYLAENKN